MLYHRAPWRFSHGEPTNDRHTRSSILIYLQRVGEKFLEWVDDPLPPDHILESITLYWLTDTFPRSIYTYRQVCNGKLGFARTLTLISHTEFPTSANPGNQQSSMVH